MGIKACKAEMGSTMSHNFKICYLTRPESETRLYLNSEHAPKELSKPLTEETVLAS